MFKNIFLPLFICIQQNKKVRVTILTFNDFKRQLMTKKTLIRTLLKLIRILVTVHLNSKNHRNTCVYLGDIYDNIGGEILIMTQYDLIFYLKYCSG